ncbi:MAG TPA: DUF1573 domain-containing protein [Terriglobia bacterium]|nr:DUF1573 domain-containing protein [Terriglobia bacterium]
MNRFGPCFISRQAASGGRSRLAVAALVLALWQAAASPAPAYQIGGLQGATAAEQLADLLQRRVQEFYTLVQNRQIPRAEEYVTKASRHRLREQIGNPFLGFKVVAVEVRPDGKSATVAAELTVLAPFATAPVPMRRTSTWVMEEGEWRIDIPEPPANTLESQLGKGGSEPAKPEQLKFEGHTYGMGVLKPGERGLARFPFQNVTNHVVRIAEVATGCECLVVKTKQMEYQPGEKGHLEIEFDSTNFEFLYDQTVVVRTVPDDVKSYLRVLAQVVPRAIAFPENKPAQN